MRTRWERVKIAVTIGPASASPKVLERMLVEGVDAVRINASHVEPEAVGYWVERIRRAGRRVGRDVAVLLDLQGIKRRIGDLKEPIRLTEGETVVLADRGGEGRIPVRLALILPHLRRGAALFLSDGFLRLEVLSVKKHEVKGRVVRGGLLKSRAGINLPGLPVLTSVPTRRDVEHVRAGVKAKVDFLALSFVREAKDLVRCRRHAAGIPIIAKIERPEAVANIDTITAASDGILIARGDLAVEMRPEELPVLQKSLIGAAKRARKPVMVATEMLASMVHSPRPTRAELLDVGNAVLDGADATLLSDETAIGHDPARAVRYMQRILSTVENSLLTYDLELPRLTGRAGSRPDWAVADAAVDVAKKVGARAIVTITGSGRTARLISADRPSVPIYSFATDPAVRRRVALMWGVSADTVKPIRDPEKILAHTLERLRRDGSLRKGDLVVCVYGSPIWAPGTRTNTVRVARA
ncbi:MAG TPA: pyruvate kinase [Planctomycetota bacterium]|nr:pyruvate kinase [Planctomycetota bacterium]